MHATRPAVRSSHADAVLPSDDPPYQPRMARSSPTLSLLEARSLQLTLCQICTLIWEVSQAGQPPPLRIVVDCFRSLWTTGTSMSSPIAAGAVVLLKAAKGKDIPLDAIRQRLVQGAQPIKAVGSDKLLSAYYQGGGMINITTSIDMTTLVEPYRISLGDSAARKRQPELSILVTNVGQGDQSYTLSSVAAQSLLALRDSQGRIAGDTDVPWLNKPEPASAEATLDFEPAKFSLGELYRQGGLADRQTLTSVSLPFHSRSRHAKGDHHLACTRRQSSSASLFRLHPSAVQPSGRYSFSALRRLCWRVQRRPSPGNRNLEWHQRGPSLPDPRSLQLVDWRIDQGRWQIRASGLGREQYAIGELYACCANRSSVLRLGSCEHHLHGFSTDGPLP